ncbi:hypothetical protein DXG01_015448 [Tephrocybe rancida]|nr:hypothetical protein DXG01_015448 [Tephrocybe rancida]
MVTDKPLLFSAILGNIEVKGDIKTRKREVRSQYSVRLYVNDKKVVKSTNKPASLVLKWEWNADNQIWFEPSSMIKIVVYRGFGTGIKLLNNLVGQYEGKIIDLLENNASFDLMDEKGIPVPIKMNIALSPISKSEDYIKRFLEKVDADVSRLPSNATVANSVSTLGQVLQLTKTIMDKLSQILLEQAVQETDLQDESIQGLASTLREMLGTANAIPDLLMIQNTTNVIEETSHQSLEVASLIHEYTKLPWAGCTVKIQIPGGLKSRIDACQACCTTLKDSFSSRLHIDTNTQVKEMKAGLQQTGQMLEAIKDDKLAQKIHSWLSPPDSSKNYNEADKKRQPDTCTWLLDGKQFLDWTANPGFLWIKGKDGTLTRPTCHLLSSSIINKLSQKNPPFGIAYFFFDGRDSQTALQLHENLIRSLISQFSHQRGGIPTELADLYKRCGGHQQPSVNQLQDVLCNILNGFSHAYIVIDALDECVDREETLVWVNKVVSDTNQAMDNLHIMVTSRPERDIEKVFGTFHLCVIDVGEATANQDIIKYLECQMESKLKGFRWVALQLAELEKCLSKYEIMEQMKNLPKGLDDIYKRMLKAIDGKYWADTMTFLEWLSFSKHPLKVAEIAEAITVDFNLEDGPVFNANKHYLNPRDMLLWLTVKTGTIKLSHFSVKEYLLSTRIEKDFSISEKTSHSKISEISVAYLLQFDSFEPLTKAMLSSSPLAQYAAEHWINHTKSGGMNSTLLKLILQLFMSETAAFTNWIQIHNIDTPWIPTNHSMNKVEVCLPLYYASLAGLQQVSKHLLENKAHVNAQGGHYGNALQAASLGGHEGIVRLLLEKEANVNAQGGQYGNALQAASLGGHEDIVRLLLEKGADVNAKGGQYGKALQAASSKGHEGVVRLLLDKEADVNAQGGYHGNALQAACYSGHEGIVRLLLKKGADVNVQGGKALQAASLGGHEGIVRLLLEKEADVNAQGGEYGNALQAASLGGHEDIVRLLLEKEADINVQGGYYGNALQAASLGGHEGIVRLLLEKEADVNAQGGEYGNALQAASLEGHEDIVRLLLEKEADVNAQEGEYGNALQVASYRGHEDIVRLLLEKEADVNAQGGYYGNALQAASLGGHEDIVRLLLEKEADINVQGGYYGNALQAASLGGHEGIVRLLLEKEADVNAQGGEYGNALQAASY